MVNMAGLQDETPFHGSEYIQVYPIGEDIYMPNPLQGVVWVFNGTDCKQRPYDDSYKDTPHYVTKLGVIEMNDDESPRFTFATEGPQRLKAAEQSALMKFAGNICTQHCPVRGHCPRIDSRDYVPLEPLLHRRGLSIDCPQP